ncbi:MAG TPA: class D sortase [Chloroflexia bacterium]|nr:class D sortase [Chloroflexia bacterium]
MASRDTISRRGLWGRRDRGRQAGSIPQPEALAGENDRFRPSSLRPVDGGRRRIALLPSQRREARNTAGQGASSLPLRIFDTALLVIEVVSAMVVSWLVWQYVYTAYFDTAPRRVSPPRSEQVLPMTTPTRQPTPTRLAEVLPPLEGTSDGQEWTPGKVGGANAPPTATATPAPTVDPQILLPARLRIPAMFLDSPVHEVTVNMGEWEVSPMDVGHHEGTANPGEMGNVVLAGHRDINSALFRDLDRLQPGDEVFVSNNLREFRYVVTESFVVGPDHAEVMDPTDDKRVTLITCTPIGLATQRLVVTAILDETYSTR